MTHRTTNRIPGIVPARHPYRSRDPYPAAESNGRIQQAHTCRCPFGAPAVAFPVER